MTLFQQFGFFLLLFSSFHQFNAIHTLKVYCTPTSCCWIVSGMNTERIVLGISKIKIPYTINSIYSCTHNGDRLDFSWIILFSRNWTQIHNFFKKTEKSFCSGNGIFWVNFFYPLVYNAHSLVNWLKCMRKLFRMTSYKNKIYAVRKSFGNILNEHHSSCSHRSENLTGRTHLTLRLS